MKAVIIPSNISGQITAPASKSAMQRACAAALIRTGRTILHNPGISADDKAALNIIQQLGADVEEAERGILIQSTGIKPASNRIDCGESGLSVRMFTSIAAVSDQPIEIHGRGSLVKRPLGFFDEVLPQLGVHCESNTGLLPLKVEGPLQPKNIEVDGSLSSQFLTGLLFAFAAAGARDVSITVNKLNSKPYIDLTMAVMKKFGLHTPVTQDYSQFYFDKQLIPYPSTPDPLIYTIESDWSGGAFLLVAGAIAGNISVNGLDIFSTQGDKAILQALMQSGAPMSITEEKIEVSRGILKPFQINAIDCPDLFPPLVALAAFCNGTSVIEGVHRLTHKESNRAFSLQEEFGKMGVVIDLQGDLMLIHGTGKVNGHQVQSHHDHRIAMACAVAALGANEKTIVEDAEAVNKSYPQFWDHLKKLNAELSLMNN